VPQLAKLRGLETLKISYCPLGNVGLETILAACPSLKRVTVEGCWLSTLCIFRAVRNHPDLKLWATGDPLPPANHGRCCVSNMRSSVGGCGLGGRPPGAHPQAADTTDSISQQVAPKSACVALVGAKSSTNQTGARNGS